MNSGFQISSLVLMILMRLKHCTLDALSC